MSTGKRTQTTSIIRLEASGEYGREVTAIAKMTRLNVTTNIADRMIRGQ